MKRKTPTTFAAVAKAIDANGYGVIPIDGKDKKKPDPRIGNWLDYKLKNGDLEKYSECGLGILCGIVRAVDDDVRDPQVVVELNALRVRMLGLAPHRIGSAPKQIHLYRTATPGPKITGKSWTLPGDGPKDKAHRVEVLGEGQQFVAFGLHRDTGKPYRWNGAGNPLTVPLADLPLVTEDQLRNYVAEADKILAKYGTERRTVEVNFDPDAQRGSNSQKVSSDYRRLLDVMASLPNEGDRDQWVRIGHAFYNACGKRASTDEAFAVWDTWSAKHESYNANNTRSAWKSFAKPSSRPAAQRLGAGTIFEYAKRYTVKKPPRRLKKRREPPALVDLTESASAITGMKLDPIEPLIKDIIYPGAYLFTGRPKVGKSWLMTQAGIAVATGKLFLGHQVTRPRNVLYIAAEDNNHRLQKRLQILAELGLPPPKNLLVLNQENFIATAERNADGLTFPQWLGQYIAAKDIGFSLVDTETTVRQIWDGERDVERLHERATEQDYRQTREFDRVALEHQAVIFLTNHAAKRKGTVADYHETINRTGTAMAGVSGSITLADPPDHDVLSAESTTRRFILSIRGRDLVNDVVRLVENSATDPIFQDVGEFAKVEQSRNENEILQAVLDIRSGPDDFVSSNEIAQELGKKAGTVKQAITRMVESERTNWRGYRIEIRRGRGGGIRLVGTGSAE